MGDLLDSVVSNTPPKVADSGPTSPASAAQRPVAGDHRRAAGAPLGYQPGTPDTIINQDMSTGDKSNMIRNKQEVNVYSDRPVYYFALQPFELQDCGDGTCKPMRLSPGTPLRADRTYRVSVTLSPNSYNSLPDSIGQTHRLTQYPLRITEEVFVYLVISNPQHNIDDAVQPNTFAQRRLSLKDSAAQSQDFDFIIRKSYPLNVTIQVWFHIHEKEMLNLGAMLELVMEGSDNAPPFHEVLHLPADAVPPASTAILHVSMADEEHLRLIGWAGKRADSYLNLDLEVFRWTDIENGPDEATYLKALTNKFYDYTVGEAGAAVSDWFDKVLGLYGDECSIVIVDETGSQFPWEMFKLKDGRYLGALAFIVRWARSQYGNSNATVLNNSTSSKGRICAYVHPTDVAKIAQDPTMSRLLPTPKQTPLAFQRDLFRSNGVSQVGLVYLCYGGILSYGDEQQMLASLLRFKPYMDVIEIRFNLVGGRLNPRPVFFANAPYSGRILMSGQKSCGLANAILTQVAASYIGTLAPIERSYATCFAHKLLEAAASDAGVKPAEWLRQLRANAVARLENANLSQEEWDQAYQEFVYPFMYVHYGHPHDWMKIDCALGSCETKREGEDV